MRSHLNGTFNLFVKNWFLEKDLESPLILFFFKGKKKKEKKTLCDFLFGKDMFTKIESGFEGQVTYWEDTVVNRNTFLNLYTVSTKRINGVVTIN